MNIALIGPSGVGKGTHAGNLIEKFDLLHLVTGDLFRENIEMRRAVGFLAKRYINQGELVPDEVVDAMVEEWLWRADPTKGVLFDGFPRTIYQAQFLDALFKELERDLAAVIYLDVSEAEATRRLTGRIVCRQCQTPYHLSLNPPAQTQRCDMCSGELYRRPDDIPEMVRVRLRAFNRVTKPLVEYYRESDRLIIIDGEKEIGQVSQAVVEAVEMTRRHEIPAATLTEMEQIRALRETSALSPEQAAQRGLNLVLLGGPGSGKGTQADGLKNEFNLQHISTGDLFRENLKEETDLGKLAKTYMDRGELVPDDVTEAMVEERLSRPDTEKGIILDGFPRTLPQAEALTDIMANLKSRINGVLYIRVSDEAIIERLSGRLICRECQATFHRTFNPFKTCPYHKCQGEYLYQRDDDQPKTIRARLKTFHAQTAPLINYYRDAGLLIEVDGEGAVSAVMDRMLAAVRKVLV